MSGAPQVTMAKVGHGNDGKSKALMSSYWVRGGGDAEGVVVVVGWMFSKRRHLKPYARLYGAARCDSLVCHPHVLNLWFPSRAEALAVQILDELLQEVGSKPRPILFATFSGGAKACLYKIFQILQAGPNEEAGIRYAGKYNSVRACVRGQIHDSSPVDFVSALGARFTNFSVSQSLGRSVYGLPALSQAGATILDALFLPKFELQRANYWLTLKESSKLGPILILCSTNDDLAPFDIINKFAVAVRESGCAIDLVVWDSSDHVGHFRNFPKEYQAAVTTFLDQQLRPPIGTSIKVTATVGSENERILPTENSDEGSGTEPPFHMRPSRSTISPSLLSSQDNSSPPSRNGLLKSRL